MGCSKFFWWLFKTKCLLVNQIIFFKKIPNSTLFFYLTLDQNHRKSYYQKILYKRILFIKWVDIKSLTKKLTQQVNRNKNLKTNLKSLHQNYDFRDEGHILNFLTAKFKLFTWNNYNFVVYNIPNQNQHI